MNLTSVISGKKYQSDKYNFQDPDGSPYYASLVNDNIDFLGKSVLGEGNTPLLESYLISSKLNLKSLHLKMENLNPTGSFKDRESAYLFEKIIKSENQNVSIVSSGNAAISATVYAKKYDKKCHCYVSNTTPQEKIDYIKILGGDVIQVEGEYEDIYRKLVEENNQDKINITSGQIIGRENGDIPIVLESYKKIKPSIIVVPVGNGSLLYGVYKGLTCLLEKNVISELPKIIGVEIKNHAPVAEAIRKNEFWHKISEDPVSIADAGIAAKEAFCSPKAIYALKQTNGYMVEINDNELLDAQKLLLEEGVICEPSSASVIAALPKIEGIESEDVLAIISGSGQKMISKILKWLHA